LGAIKPKGLNRIDKNLLRSSFGEILFYYTTSLIIKPIDTKHVLYKLADINYKHTNEYGSMDI